MTARLGRWLSSLDTLEKRIARAPTVRRYGRLTRATGLVLEATGLQLPLGATCLIERHDAGEVQEVESEVVGFNGQRLFLMPLEEVEGIVPGARVYARIAPEGQSAGKQLPLGPALLGRVLDGSAKPLDGLPSPETGYRAPLITAPFNPCSARRSSRCWTWGAHHQRTADRRPRPAYGPVRRLRRRQERAARHDGPLYPGGCDRRWPDRRAWPRGQRLYREHSRRRRPGALGGDRRAGGRVAAAAHAGAAYATRIAEDFRDRGQHVLLIMDSLTRYAMAQREIALAIGEPPATKGYPPSVFAKLPALVERAGNGISGGGSITAFYTVLTEGDDQQDPIADSARAILDGHVVLSRRLAEAGHYPAIDIEASISRAMTSLIDEEHYRRVRTFKQMLASYQRNRDLISVGAYTAGSDPLLDKAMTLYPQMEAYLQQGIFERSGYDEACQQLQQLIV